MEESGDPSRAVADAVTRLRRAVNADQFSQNAGLRADLQEFRVAREQLHQALKLAGLIIRSPQPGQGLWSIWLRVVLQQFLAIKAAVRRHHGDWDQLLSHDNENLIWLVMGGWESSYKIAHFKRPRQDDLALLLEQDPSAFGRLRQLALDWAEPPIEAAEFPMRRVGNLLLQAIDDVEVARSWYESSEFCERVLHSVDMPSGLAAAYLNVASPNALIELIRLFEGSGESDKTPSLAEASPAIPPQTISKLHEKEPVVKSPSGALKLFGPQFGVLTHNVERLPLTAPQYDVLLALCRAGERGLARKQLVDESKRGGAIRTLKNLAASDPAWGSIIYLPGTTGRRYRVL